MESAKILHLKSIRGERREETRAVFTEEAITPSRVPSDHEDASTQANPVQIQNRNLAERQDRRRRQQFTTGSQNVRSHVGAQSQAGAGITAFGEPQRLQSRGQSHAQTQAQPQHQPQLRQAAMADANNGDLRPAATARIGRTLRLEFEYLDGILSCRDLDTRTDFFRVHVGSIVLASTLAMIHVLLIRLSTAGLHLRQRDIHYPPPPTDCSVFVVFKSCHMFTNNLVGYVHIHCLLDPALIRREWLSAASLRYVSS